LSQPPYNDPSDADPTVRRWKRILLGIYLLFTGVAVIWAFASLVAFNCGGHAVPVKGPRISPAADNPKELRACHKKLERLLTDLHEETFALQANALRYRTDPAAEWRNWSEAWKLRWQALRWRCRLDELGGSGVSPAIDQMAAIHAALEELRLSYTGLVDTFIERYTERLQNLRKDLAAVRTTIDRRHARRNK
jgi:hypothetical protein